MFCIKMNGRIKRILQRFDSYINEHADTALKITGILKEILSSPVADIITALIPGEADDMIRRQLLAALEYATNALLINEDCKGCTGLNEKLQCLKRHLLQYPAEKRDALLQKLACLLTSQLDGQRLKQHLYDLFVQAKYTLTKDTDKEN